MKLVVQLTVMTVSGEFLFQISWPFLSRKKMHFEIRLCEKASNFSVCALLMRSWWHVVCNMEWTWWRHQIETFSALLWPFVWRIDRLPVNSPHKGQWRCALMLTFICAWINGRVNNRKASDLRRHLDHYDVIVMCIIWGSWRATRGL